MYSKVFSSMYNGTLATKGPWEALVTFQQMLILADKYGTLDMTPDAISRVTTIPLEIITKGIAVLEQPDPLSRRDDNDGRRISRLRENTDWGWSITNYEYYRNLRTAEERQLYFREYKRKQRAEVKETKPASAGLVFTLPDWLNAEQFAHWIKTRPAKTRTPESLAAAVKKLDKMRGQGIDPNEVIGESLANGWRGLFAPDRKKSGGKDYSVEASVRAFEERENGKT